MPTSKAKTTRQILFEIAFGYLGAMTWLMFITAAHVIAVLTKERVRQNWAFYGIIAFVGYYFYANDLYYEALNSVYEHPYFFTYWGISAIYAFIKMIKHGLLSGKTISPFSRGGPDGSNYSDWGCG